MSVHSPIDQAIAEVLWTIPSDILRITFEPDRRNETIDEIIHRDIIDFKVSRDCNLFSGVFKNIALDNCILKPTPTEPGMVHISDTYSGLYEVPPEARDFRNISKVISVEWPFTTGRYGINAPYGGTGGAATIPGALKATLNSHAPISSYTPPIPHYMGNNIVALIPAVFSQMNWVLQCKLEYDSEFRNMNESTISLFAKMVVQATRSRIWSTMAMKIGTSYVIGGAEIGPVKDYIDDCKDADEKYEELLLSWRGAENTSPEVFQRFIRSML